MKQDFQILFSEQAYRTVMPRLTRDYFVSLLGGLMLGNLDKAI